MLATSDTRLERVKTSWRPRFLANGIEPFDYETTVARIDRFEAWPDAWATTAREHEDRAEKAEQSGHAVTAAGFRRLAALAWHFGFFAHPRPLQPWLEAQRRKAALFRKAAPFLRPPAEYIEVPFRDVKLPAYLRKPLDVERPPVVLFVSGLDSTKEEHTTFENVLLQRGLATLTFDGPGQGEVWEHLPGIVEWEQAGSAMVDAVQSRADLDGSRVGIVGVSLGGYLAPRCAALEPRIRTAAACGGLFELGGRDLNDTLHGPRSFHFWNTDDAATLRSILERCTLDGIIQRMDRPLLVVHGERDDITPVAGARRMYEAAGGPKDWVLFGEGNHVCNNIPHLYRPVVADWLREHLA
ncbi:MAG: alpha/beta hydrolase [Chloroflexi bacterium]|nr:alpha/beta hydrolase [Chloroflexota bacterium]